MKLTSTGIQNGERIPSKYAFGKHDAKSHVTLCENLSPPLAWSDVPAKAKSLALICHDRDVPSSGEDVNQEGREVSASLPRVDFFHWVLVDIPVGVEGFAEGQHSKGITARGKEGPGAPVGLRHGLNDYTGWFKGDAEMEGSYFGYDGPCPPWNDSILHHYVFTLYALDLERCPVEGAFDGPAVRAAIRGHVRDQASLTGVYSLNPALES